MPNPYYNHTSGVPAVQTRGSSPNMRAEFDAVATGFNGVYTEILALAAAVGIAVTVSEVPVASSATTDIGNGYGPVVKITGTNPITSFGANYKGAIFLRFADALLLTHSSSLVLPGAANIMTVAGDACIAIPIGNPASGWRIAAYCRMSQTLIDDVAVRTSSTYANPAWLTSLAWSKLTGVPTTLAGYGITDAPTKTGTGASGSWGIDITGTAALSLAHPIAAAAGTADAITATFSPAITAWTNGLRFTLTGCSANATTTPTVNPNGIGAKTIVNQGNLPLIIGDMPPQADLQYNSTYDAVVLLNPLEVTEAPVVTVTDNANARTFTLQPCVLMFRSATLTSGSVVKRRVPSAITFTFSSGSTAGSLNAVQSDIAAIAIDNAGTVELAANNLAGGVDLSEAGVISTTAEGGAGAANSATVVYSPTARTNVAYRVVGLVRSTQATAGTWATAPSLIQGQGGNALSSMMSLGYGQTWQSVTGSRSVGTTYYNSTGKPITIQIAANSTGAATTLVVNGTTVVNTTVLGPHTYTIPIGQSYLLSAAGGGVNYWNELR